MNQIENKIDKLIEIGEGFLWEDCSYFNAKHDETYGKEPSPEWKLWVSRIKNIMEKTVKTDSEPYVYFKTANGAVIMGNYRDKFDLAKDNYLKALNTVKSLLVDGDVFNDLLVADAPIKKEAPKRKEKIERLSKSDDKVFIVHGHDHALKIELEVFLSHIGLKPIVLHREVDGGKTIIEKFEANSDVSYAFILLTPDEISYTVDQDGVSDEDRKKEARARPNVMFGFGYFVAKLGREKVCALHKGDVAIPSDLSGFIYKKVDHDIEEIGFSLIKELKAAGLKPEL